VAGRLLAHLLVTPVVEADMNTHNLDGIFRPQRIALFGVTENPKSVAGTVLRNVVGSGFRGVVDFADLIDYFGEDDSTDSIILYIESLSEARRFMTAARAFARSWGIRRVVAETTSDNVRMIALFRERGFEVTPEEQGLVTVAKNLV